MTKRTVRDLQRITPIASMARGVVSSVFAQRHFRKLRDMVQDGPIRITIHGRTDMVVMTVDDFLSLHGQSDLAAQESARQSLPCRT